MFIPHKNFTLPFLESIEAATRERLDYLDAHPLKPGPSEVWNEYNAAIRERESNRLHAVLLLVTMLQEPQHHGEMALEISAIDLEHYLDEDWRLEARTLEIMRKQDAA